MNQIVEPPIDITAPASTPPAAWGRRWSDGVGNSAVMQDSNAPWSMTQQWPALVATLSEQAVDSSNLVLRALDFLVGAGRLGRAEAKALSDSLFQLRDTSLRAQQITRLASGRIRQARDRVDMADVIRQVLAERAAEFKAQNATVTADTFSLDVLLDPPAAVSLVNTIIDWGLSFSKELKLQLQQADWPSPARLAVRVSTPAGGLQGSPASSWSGRPRGRRINDSLHWMLLRQMAASANIKVGRTSAPGTATVTVEFPKTFINAEGLASVELLDNESSAAHIRDSWVLVVVRDPSLRKQALDALQAVNIEAKVSANFSEAAMLASTSLPALVVVGFDVPHEELHLFRAESIGTEHRCGIVEITRESPAFNINGFEGYDSAKVGREDIAKELAPAVLFELVKNS